MFQSALRHRAWSACAAALLSCTVAHAQSVESGGEGVPVDAGIDTLDPASPLAPLPDLGLDWPDPTQADAAAPAGGGVRGATSDAAAERRYLVRIEGLGALAGGDFRSRFDAASELVQGAGDPANVAQIDRRARADAETLRELLRAYGYYDAEVETRVADAAAGPGTPAGRLAVTLDATPGPLYRFAAVDLPGLDAAGGDAPALREAFAVKPQDPVSADRVAAGQAALRALLGARGYVFAKVDDPVVTVDHDTRTATLSLAVAPNGARRFGRFRLAGAPLFSEAHVARIARLHAGDRVDAARIDDLRRALIATGLVSMVELRPVATADPDVVDLAVRIERAPPRTIAGEIGYGTGEGARVAASWQHRNLIKPEGAVTLRGVLGTQEQSASAILRRGNFRQRDQVLNAQVAFSHTDRDAYDARTLTLAAGIERQTNIIWQKKWTWSYGVELVASDERDVSTATGLPRRRTFLIGALPTSLAYDGSDDLLNPTRGYRLSGRVSPEASFQGSAFSYLKVQVDGSAYLPVAGGVTLAGRMRLGSIVGASRDRLAPSRRFYAGGGSSVRGYGYQDIGPRDVDNDPTGGTSLAEFSLEARYRFGDFGIVPFFDAGNVYQADLPRFTRLRYGAGIGARYYTSFGPIRIDVGTPLNRQSGDSRIAVYVSLGQAF